jgi:Flp pilus assembly protein TadD
MSQRGASQETLETVAGRFWPGALLVAAAALVMGLPGLGGGFLGGDDIQLARDHVLVNRPSLAHAVELFRIVHRDLYQPAALLSFAIDFAVARAVPVPVGVTPEASAAFVAHLTNLLLHAGCAVLVLALVRRVSGSAVVAVLAGLLFAVHPLHVECVAWISGRMMLLSTLFLLAAIVLMDDWARRAGTWRIVLAFVFALLAMMSKVRVELPVLLVIPWLYRRPWPPRRWWGAWAAVAVITLAFAALNASASRGMLERGEEYLQGPRIVRTILALGWYFGRIVVPIGLAPFHPAPQVVSWSQPGLLAAAGIVLAVIVVVGASARRSRAGWCGLLWFLAAIAVTLPLVPARNLLVAERYTYLPNVGALAAVAALLVWTAGQATARAAQAKGISIALAAVVAAALIALSWRVCAYYRDDLHRAARIYALYPEIPEIAVRYARALHDAERCDEAAAVIEAMPAGASAVRADALGVLGSCQRRGGDVAGGLETLRQAVAIAPDDGRTWARLGAALADAADFPNAIAAYERCAELLPNQNPELARLAHLYRQTNRRDDAARIYARMQANNPFDVPSALGLAELDMEAGRYEPALRRLDDLLAWMPDNVPAQINAGVCLAAMGRFDAAEARYRAALAIDPGAVPAALNLAELLAGQGDARGALAVLEKTRSATSDASRLLPTLAWTAALTADWPVAARTSAQALQTSPDDPLARIAACAVALASGQGGAEATAHLDVLLDRGILTDQADFDRLAALLQARAEAAPADPWPYVLLARACAATNRPEIAEIAAEEARRRTSEAAILRLLDPPVPAGGE